MIPFSNLAHQNSSIQLEVTDAIFKVINSSKFILGPAVEKFEADFSAFCGTKFAFGVNSGTSALHLALTALGVGRGDEVITSAHTFLATAAAIEYAGAVPVLVDINQERFTLDPVEIKP